MLQMLKLTASKLLTNSNTRAIIILGTLLIAVAAGGAPHDWGGG